MNDGALGSGGSNDDHRPRSGRCHKTGTCRKPLSRGIEVRQDKSQDVRQRSPEVRLEHLLICLPGHEDTVGVQLLAVTTGLRRGDIETIRVGDIHFDRNTISTQKRKTGKTMPERPVPEAIMTGRSNYAAALPDGHRRPFNDRFSPKKRARIRKAVKLPDLESHDLRKRFASLRAQRGASTAVTQRLLEHSSPPLANDVYAHVDPVLRQAAELLPVGDWL
ncbi:MAG: tyrosine-type recombinase/integrase [Sedimentisphaerales bacterium]|nr:tyrosine-type recombinase/integrase [Sedimentisphaerales bacterium]